MQGTQRPRVVSSQFFRCVKAGPVNKSASQPALHPTTDERLLVLHLDTDMEELHHGGICTGVRLTTAIA